MSAGRVARAKDFASLRLYRVPHPSRVCSGGVVRPLAVVSRRGYIPAVPWGLKRFQQSRHLHFVTFSCYRRRPLLDSSGRRELVERALENARRSYRFFVTGYVVMPEHVHLLVGEPERGLLATAIQAMKQSVARRLTPRNSGHFWQARYYDFNVWSEHKRLEKLNYMHWNPVKRDLVSRPEDWLWSSFRHYATGCEGIVEIESEWTARRRERLGVTPKAVIKRK